MTDAIRDHRQIERRHMIQVKDAFAAGLAATPASSEFLLACTDYLGYIIGRFTIQGRGNLERLAPRVAAAEDQEGERVAADISRTIGETEAALADLLAAAAACRARHAQGLPELLAAGRRFIDFYNTVLAVRKDPAQEIIDRYFSSEEYWRLTNDVTAESIETETRLFERVTRNRGQTAISR